jgi:eukaryotic-like serine/threonine-protein kinase
MNNPARHQQIEELFHATLAHAPEDRAAFLQQACRNDQDLRQQVESLLDADREQGDWLDTGIMQPTTLMQEEKKPGSLIGQQIGHYQVLSMLGAGGMGEVYLAQDLKLRRKVALKMLSAQLGQDRERVQRFEREAQAVSALNHPNIITIYEVGETEDLHFIATEYVEGQTLRRLMHTNHLAPEQAVEIAIQIAQALAAAHGANILHRDIKPENVMVRPDGLIKVLDFGLAKLTGNQVSGEEDATLFLPDMPASTLTSPGKVMGTIGYMSPEQARGLSLDARTDIFSLGVMLYEMLTGHSPFTGTTPSDVMAAILTYEPPPLITFTPALRYIVNRALNKDREQRYQTSSELLADLKKLSREWEIARHSGSGETAPVSQEHTEVIAAPSTQEVSEAIPLASSSVEKKKGVVLVLSALLLGILVAGVWFLSRSNPTTSFAPFQAMALNRVTISGKIAHEQAVISPDGKYLVYVVDEAGQQSMWFKQMATGANVRIIPPTKIVYTGLTVSHDNNYIYYVAQDEAEATALYKMPLVGGAARKILTHISSSPALSPDDRQITFVRNDSLVRESALIIATAEGAEERKVTTRRFPEQFFWPVWSPSGDSIACVSQRTSPEGRYNELVRIITTNGSEQLISKRRWSYAGQMVWLPDQSGLLLNAADQSTSPTQIWELQLPEGAARKITNDLNNYSGLSLTANAQALVTIQTEKSSELWLVPQGETSQAKQIIFGGGKYAGVMGLTWTPDNRIIYSSTATTNPDLGSGDPDLWIMQADGSQQTQLTANARTNIRPVMTADGRYIVWASNRSGKHYIWRMNADGTNPIALTNGLDDVAPDCSPDGRWVVYQGIKDARAVIMKVSIDGGPAIPLTEMTAARPVVSPDGRSIACFYYDAQTTPHRWRLAVLPFAGGPLIKLMDLSSTTDRLIAPRWTADGEALVCVDTNNGVSNLWRHPLDGTAPVQITNFKTDLIFNFAWSQDGKQLVCARGSINHDVVMISNFR